MKKFLICAIVIPQQAKADRKTCLHVGSGIGLTREPRALAYASKPTFHGLADIEKSSWINNRSMILLQLIKLQPVHASVYK